VREVLRLEASATADPKAGVGTRDVEEACAMQGADPNVFNGRRLPNGKVSRLCPGNRAETCCRPEEKALNELHSALQC
jgi:hypothetical protein